MGSINDKIASLKGYFKGMNVAEGFVYVTVEFPEGWFINDDLCAHYEVRAAKEKNDGTYYFFTSMAIGFDAVFDAILETIKYNEVSISCFESNSVNNFGFSLTLLYITVYNGFFISKRSRNQAKIRH